MRYCLVIVATLSVVFGFSQKNFQRAFIVTNDNDTLHGFINYLEREKNPTSFEFKRSLQTSSVENFSTENIRLAEIVGMEQYRRCECKISLDNAVDEARLPEGLDTTSKTAVILLRRVSKGNNLTLFNYTDEIKSRFYIQSGNDGQPKELIYRRYIDLESAERVVIERPEYKNALNSYAIHYNVNPLLFQQKLTKARYTEKDVKQLVDIINASSENESKADTKLQKRRFFINAGMSRAVLHFTGQEGIAATSFQFSDSYSPVVSAGIDFFANPRIGRVIFRQEFGITVNDFKGASSFAYPQEYRLKQAILSMGSHYLYNFYNSEYFKFFAGGGLALNYVKVSENKIVRHGTISNTIVEGYEFRSITASVIPRIGFLFGRWEASLGVALSIIQPTENYIAFSGKYRAQQLKFGYVFGKERR